MSDPQTNPQIEDVLSSVRRLVSTTRRDVSPAATPEPLVTTAQGRLLLTPALRVAGPNETLEFIADTPADPVKLTDSVPEHFRTTRDSLEATIAELEAAVTAQPDEWEPDGSEVKTVPTWETVSYPPLDEVEDAEAIEETSPDDMRGEAALAALLNSGPLILEDAAFDATEPVTNESDISSLTFLRTQPIPVPDPIEEDDEDYGDELAPDAEAADDLESYLEDDGETIDEEALREMVLAIVREELQGKLGERITRNVRKMVRREVHRALDIKGLD